MRKPIFGTRAWRIPHIEKASIQIHGESCILKTTACRFYGEFRILRKPVFGIHVKSHTLRKHVVRIHGESCILMKSPVFGIHRQFRILRKPISRINGESRILTRPWDSWRIPNIEKASIQDSWRITNIEQANIWEYWKMPNI